MTAATVPEREAPGVARLDSRRQQLQRLRWKGLRRPSLFAWNGTARHGAFLHREQRLAVAPVEHEDEALLAHLCERRDSLAALAAPVEQDGLRGRVVVPQVVVHQLESPGHLAGRQAQRDGRVGIAVTSHAQRAVVVG
ncbi:MAG: hypothetical protein IPF84_17690 [Proteobacteria bacterium]|nr:hypothetical protein [Pseudomonadota bacterium]